MARGKRDFRGAQGADDGEFQPPTMRDTLRGMGPSLLVNGVLTFLAYQVLVKQHVSSVTALILTALIPAIWTIGSVARTRRVDALVHESIRFWSVYRPI